MKTQNVLEYLSQSIDLELNASKLYSLFASLNPEDSIFWNKISFEEVNHASLLRSGIEFYKLNMFPVNILSNDIEELKAVNNEFDKIMSDYIKNPSRKKAFQIAIDLETSAGESHFQDFMSDENENSQISKIFKKLNHDDVDHLNRLIEYMEENNL